MAAINGGALRKGHREAVTAAASCHAARQFGTLYAGPSSVHWQKLVV